MTPSGSDEVAHPQGLAHLQVAHVERDLLGDALGRRADAEAGEELLEDAAFPLDLGGDTHHDHGHLGLDDLVAAYDLEIDVGHGTPHRVALELAGQDQVGRTLNL